MKQLMKLALFGAGVLLALLALHGCFGPAAPFAVTVTPDSGSEDVEVVYELDDLIVYRCRECGQTFEE